MTFFDNLTFRLFPGNCITCGRPSHRDLDICQACESDLPWLGNCCESCALPTEIGFDKCGRCIVNPPPFEQTICAFSYSFPVDLLIQRFKNRRHLASGRVLATLLANRVARRVIIEANIIVPTPLHPGKRRQRGFNQAEVIALVLSGLIKVPVNTTCIRRQKVTRDQKLLSVRERRSNVRSAFTITEKLDGSHVLLVDDVITTSATVTEITHCLLKGGASAVTVLAVARTPGHPFP